MVKKQDSDSEVYVKLDYSDSVNAKRNLLEMTGSAISLQMIADKIKKLSREEISERSEEKKQLKMMIVEINKLLESMPKIKIEKPKEQKVEVHAKKIEKKEVKAKEQNPQKTERKTLNDELQEVRKKIEGLKK